MQELGVLCRLALGHWFYSLRAEFPTKAAAAAAIAAAGRGKQPKAKKQPSAIERTLGVLKKEGMLQIGCRDAARDRCVALVPPLHSACRNSMQDIVDSASMAPVPAASSAAAVAQPCDKDQAAERVYTPWQIC
jgi:hypothetical protein